MIHIYANLLLMNISRKKLDDQRMSVDVVHGNSIKVICYKEKISLLNCQIKLLKRNVDVLTIHSIVSKVGLNR